MHCTSSYSFCHKLYLFLWDVLTTAQIGKESLTDSIELKVDVYTKGPSQGRTYKSDGGRIVRVVNHVNHDEFFNYITSLAKKYLINFKCKLFI